MMSLGRRLQEERARLGLSQEEMARAGGIARTSQHLYESNARSPNAEYLMKLLVAGADVSYLITGHPTSHALGGAGVSIAKALSAYREVEAFVREQAEEVSPEEREKLFLFACTR